MVLWRWLWLLSMVKALTASEETPGHYPALNAISIFHIDQDTILAHSDAPGRTGFSRYGQEYTLTQELFYPESMAFLCQTVVRRTTISQKFPPYLINYTSCGAIGLHSTTARFSTFFHSKQGYYTIHTYAVSAKELLEPVTIPLTLNGQPHVFAYGLSLSPILGKMITQEGASGQALGSHARSFCQSQAIPEAQGCALQLVDAVKLASEERVSGWLDAIDSSSRQVNTHGIIITDREPAKGNPAYTNALENEVAVLINTNDRFVKTSLPRLLDSLLKNNWPSHLIYVVVGGSSEEQTRVDAATGVTFWETQGDLIDFTAFWTLMKHYQALNRSQANLPAPPPFQDHPSYWFYMHDTMEVGPQFRPWLLTKVALLIEARGGASIGSIALTSQSGKSMNLGLYAHSDLLSKAIAFEKDVVQPLLQMDLYTRKARGGELEDYLLQPLSLVLCLVQDVETTPRDVYGTGTLRRVLVYPEVDLYKYQGNWVVKQGGSFNMEL